jgi:hypothetical protein
MEMRIKGLGLFPSHGLLLTCLTVIDVVLATPVPMTQHVRACAIADVHCFSGWAVRADGAWSIKRLPVWTSTDSSRACILLQALLRQALPRRH